MVAPNDTLPNVVSMETLKLKAAIQSGRRPVIVYSHPKTASRSIEQALQNVPEIAVFHTHVLRPLHFTSRFEPTTDILEGGMVQHSEPTQWPLLKRVVESSVEYSTISLARDPVATTASWLYFGIQRWLRSWRKIDPALLSDDDWREVFTHHFPQRGAWTWWDYEFAHVTGVCPGADGFDAERGWSSYDRGRLQSMIVSTHLKDHIKAEALETFLHVSVPEIERANQSHERAGRAQYDRVRRLLAQERSFRAEMLESAYAKLFFTAKQRSDFACRWDDMAGTKI